MASAVWFSFRKNSLQLAEKSLYQINRKYIAKSLINNLRSKNFVINQYKPVYIARRYFCLQKYVSDEEVKKHVDDLSEKFSEAVGLLEDARQSLGTVYFSEDMKDAENTVTTILNEYNSLLEKLHETQRMNVNRTIGLKMHELQAQLQMIREMCRE